MIHPLAEVDVAAILASFERSGFGRLTLELGPARVAASRTVPAAAVAAAATAQVAAPLLGFFQAGREPGAPALVRPSERVTEGTVVGMIRVLEDVNAIEAGCRGIVAAVHVRDGEFVEYGQALMTVLLDLAPDPGAAARAGQGRVR